MGTLFGLPWKKHGRRKPHECIPVFQFSGRGRMFKQLLETQWWAGSGESLGYMQMTGESKFVDGHFAPWDGDSPGKWAHAKIMNFGTLKSVAIRVQENSMPHDFEFGLYRDRKLDRKIFAGANRIRANTIDTYSRNLEAPLSFEHRYAYGFQTASGNAPNYQDPTQTMRISITSYIEWGGGDPD